MGDGHVNRGHETPYVDINTISRQYLEYLDDKFGCLTTGVRLQKEAGEQAANCRKSGFVENADEEDYNDIYVLKTRSHPELRQYAEWYSSGKKVWPYDIVLTPTTLKHWYCGDGSKDDYEGVETIRIATANEHRNEDKLRSLFTSVGLPEPNLVYQGEGEGCYCSLRFNSSESRELWEYMGEPLPDFKYKWPSAVGVTDCDT